MTYYKLSLIDFLLYLELLLVIVIIFKAFLIAPLIIAIGSAFSVVSYKLDALNLYFNIPFSILELIIIQILIHSNTLNSPILVKSLFWVGGILIFTINKLISQNSIYSLATKQHDFLLHYTARKYFKINKWLFFVGFFLVILLGYDLTNPITTVLFDFLTFLFRNKYIGWILPTIAWMLLAGSVSYSIYFLFNYRDLKRDFDQDFHSLIR